MLSVHCQTQLCEPKQKFHWESKRNSNLRTGMLGIDLTHASLIACKLLSEYEISWEQVVRPR